MQSYVGNLNIEQYLSISLADIHSCKLYQALLTCFIMKNSNLSQKPPTLFHLHSTLHQFGITSGEGRLMGYLQGLGAI